MIHIFTFTQLWHSNFPFESCLKVGGRVSGDHLCVSDDCVDLKVLVDEVVMFNVDNRRLVSVEKRRHVELMKEAQLLEYAKKRAPYLFEPSPPPAKPTPGNIPEGWSSESFVDRIKEILSLRQGQYAHPSVNHQITADMFSIWWHERAAAYVHSLGNNLKMIRLASGSSYLVPFTAEDVCTFNLIQKLARCTYGSHDDSLLDNVGYTENIAMLKPEQRNFHKPQETKS